MSFPVTEAQGDLHATGQVALGGGLGSTSGSATSPAAFRTLAEWDIPAGTWAAHWSVTLAGTTGAQDADNFQLKTPEGNVFPSVNDGAAGTWEQAPALFTTAGGAAFLQVAGNAGTTGSIYSATVTGDGSGVLTFDPANARQRWVVKSVVVSTSQDATATVVPVATVGKNTVVASQLSQGNNRGASWSGNQDIFSGEIAVSPADFLSVLFTPPPGATAAQVAQLAGVICYATVTGSRYTRRA